MATINYIFITIIIIYLFYIYFKIKKGSTVEKSADMILPREHNEMSFYNCAVSAVIALLMEEKEYKIKRIFYLPEVQNNLAWKNFGRQEYMNKKLFLSTKRKEK